MGSGVTLAYLAGALDADGFFGIRKSTYRMRVSKDAHCPLYSERTGLKQVTPQVPELLRDTFGGSLSIQRANARNGKPLHGWSATDKTAAEVARALLPFLRIKTEQARCLLSLRATKDNPRFRTVAYWFALEHPKWTKGALISYAETAAMLGYAQLESVSQAVSNGSLLALPKSTPGAPRIPRALVELFTAGPPRTPPQLLAQRERIWAECRELNRIGTGKHPISERTGPYALAT